WVNQILGDLGELLRVHPATRNNQLIIHPLVEDVAVPINGTDLIQILLNLTLNALQCTSQCHRVEIRGQVHTQPLDLSLFEDGPADLFLALQSLPNTAPLRAPPTPPAYPRTSCPPSSHPMPPRNHDPKAQASACPSSSGCSRNPAAPCMPTASRAPARNSRSICHPMSPPPTPPSPWKVD